MQWKEIEFYWVACIMHCLHTVLAPKIFNNKKNKESRNRWYYPLPCPPSPQGPDINNMESDWDYMKKQKQTRQPKSTEEPQQGLRDTQSHLTAAEPNTDLHF